MALADSLEEIHRRLSRLWSDADARPGVLTQSEYEYLRAIERLDGGQIAKFSDRENQEVGQDGAPEKDTHQSGHQGHHLQDLVTSLGVRKASASAAIAKLEKRGFVRRFPCQYDARAQHIVLTNKAREHLHQEGDVYRTAAERVASQCSLEELEALKNALKKLEANL